LGLGVRMVHFYLGLLKNKKILWVSVGIVGFTCIFFAQAFYDIIYVPMSSRAVFQVQPTTSANIFVRNLTQNHWVRYPRLFLLLIRCEGLSSRLKTGFYQMQPEESAHQFLHRVVSGDVLHLPFQIIDGMTKTQVDQKMRLSPYLNHQTNHVLEEGSLLAETYYYTAGSDGQTLLQQAKRALNNCLATAWAHRSPNLPYHSSYELLIAASILEKEASDREERSLISGVIINRLKSHMPLQMDPTVIYALGPAYHGHLSHDDLKIDSPYNTYRYRGLPPTPIAMVGKEAMLAAAHPTRSNYLYFVARGGGRHVFSADYEAQKQAIQRYQHGRT